MAKQYAQRDIESLDGYMKHVMAMTVEQLHSKSDIAAELAWRDSQIAALQQKLDAISAKALELCSEAAQVYQKYNVTQMPDRDLVDHQTIQELSDLIRSGTHETADKAG